MVLCSNPSQSFYKIKVGSKFDCVNKWIFEVRRTPFIPYKKLKTKIQNVYDFFRGIFNYKNYGKKD